MVSTSRTQSSDKEDTKAAWFQRQEHSPVIRTLRLHGFSSVIRTLRLHAFNDKNSNNSDDQAVAKQT